MCIRACMDVFEFAGYSSCSRACEFMCSLTTHVHKYVHTCMFAHTTNTMYTFYMHTKRTSDAYTQARMCMSVCVCVCVCVSVCVSVCLCVCVCGHTPACIQGLHACVAHTSKRCSCFAHTSMHEEISVAHTHHNAIVAAVLMATMHHAERKTHKEDRVMP
jgi:hypothetical protein